MKNLIKDYFLKLRKYFLSERENFLFLIVLFLGIFLIIFNKSELKKLTPLKPNYGGIYREGLYEDIESLNPILPQNDSQKAIINLIYPPLIEFDNGRLISKFIKSYSFSPDFLSYVFELKNGLKWSDGNQLTSEDILFAFKILKREGPAEISTLFNDIEAKVIDPLKIEFVLKTNDNYFLFKLKYLRPLPEKVFSKTEKISFEELKIGSGPFVLESWRRNKDFFSLVLKRNENYEPRPHLDKVVFYVYPSAKRAFDGLLLKEIDGLAGLNYFNLPTNIFTHFDVYKIILPRVIGLFLNSQKVESNTFEFLEENINRSYLIKTVFNSYAEETKDLFSPTIKKIFQINQIHSLEKNSLKKENSSLRKPITLTVSSFYFYPDLARYFRDKLGLKIEFVDNETLKEKLKNKDYEIILSGINYDHPPAPFYFWSQAGFNINNLENIDLEKNFQKLINDPKTNLNEELSKIEEKIIKSKNNIFLLNPYYLYFLNKEISGFDQFYLFAPEARFVKIESWFKRK